jgi:hypothetical protein
MWEPVLQTRPYKLSTCVTAGVAHKRTLTVKAISAKHRSKFVALSLLTSNGVSPLKLTRVPPTVHNTLVKILDMVYFLTHDLYNIALDSNSHHKNFKLYDHSDQVYQVV